MHSITVHPFQTGLINVVVGKSLEWIDNDAPGSFDCTALGLTLEEARKAVQFLETPDAHDVDMQCGSCKLYA